MHPNHWLDTNSIGVSVGDITLEYPVDRGRWIAINCRITGGFFTSSILSESPLLVIGAGCVVAAGTSLLGIGRFAGCGRWHDSQGSVMIGRLLFTARVLAGKRVRESSSNGDPGGLVPVPAASKAEGPISGGARHRAVVRSTGNETKRISGH